MSQKNFYSQMSSHGGDIMVTSLNRGDLSQLLPIMEQAHHEVYQGPVNKEKFHQYWDMVIETNSGGILVHHTNEAIKGFLGYVCDTNPCTYEDGLCVIFIYVLPEYRGGHIYEDLISNLEILSDTIEIYAHSPGAQIFLEKRGYYQTSVIYRK